MTGETHCPLCAGNALAPYHQDRRRPYRQCGTCCLVFVPPGWYLTPEAELAQYNFHQNEVGRRGMYPNICRPGSAAGDPAAGFFDLLRKRLHVGRVGPAVDGAPGGEDGRLHLATAAGWQAVQTCSAT